MTSLLDRTLEQASHHLLTIGDMPAEDGVRGHGSTDDHARYAPHSATLPPAKDRVLPTLYLPANDGAGDHCRSVAQNGPVPGAEPCDDDGLRSHDTHTCTAVVGEEPEEGGGHIAGDAQKEAAASLPKLTRTQRRKGLVSQDIDGTDLVRLHYLMGVYGREWLDMQRIRVAFSNRVDALERDGNLGYAGPLLKALEDAQKAEAGLHRELERLARIHPLGEFILGVQGVALPSLSIVLSITGRLDAFPTVSKLWKFMGMAVHDGRAPHRERGVPFVKRADADVLGVEATAYSPEGRTRSHLIGLAFRYQRPESGCLYRDLYDAKKLEYLARERTGPSACPFGQTHRERGGGIVKCGDAHAENAAIRYAAKCFLRDLWVAWHRYVPAEVD